MSTHFSGVVITRKCGRCEKSSLLEKQYASSDAVADEKAEQERIPLFISLLRKGGRYRVVFLQPQPKKVN
jgi:hypothetical protein